MEFTLLNAGLAAGAALAAVPVILHLVLRQKPKHLQFPALRLIRQRQRVNQRKLRLRHLLLLALRMLVIACLAIALAQPSARVAGTGSILPDQEAPVLAVMVFDTSLSMGCRQEGKTRLEAAQELAAALLEDLPNDSRVAVLTTGRAPADPDPTERGAGFMPGIDSVRRRIEALRPSSASQALNPALRTALRLFEAEHRSASDPWSRQEIYFFTDMTRGSWLDEDPAPLQRMLDQADNLGIYVVDVGLDDLQNFAVTNVVASADRVPRNAPFTVRATVTASGEGGTRNVELTLEDEQGIPRRRGRQTVELQAGRSREVVFQVSGLTRSVHQGEVRLSGEDPLSFDDARAVTVGVLPVVEVLVVDDTLPDDTTRRAVSDATILVEMLAPSSLPDARQQFRCELARAADLTRRDLSAYDAVCLVNVPALSDDAWNALAVFVRRGGGLGVFPGGRVDPQSYNTAAAQAVLPAELQSVARPQQPVTLAPPNYGHAILAGLREHEGGLLTLLPVRRYWELGQLAETASNIIPYSNGEPALAYRSAGRGRVVLFTTSVAESDVTARVAESWNDVVLEDWSFFVLLRTTVHYLAGSVSDGSLNYEAGQTAVVTLPHGARLSEYVLYIPARPEIAQEGQQIRQSNDPTSDTIAVRDTAALGNYRIIGQAHTPQARGARRAAPQPPRQAETADAQAPLLDEHAPDDPNRIDLGFSVNPSAAESQLVRIPKTQLDTLLGAERYHFAAGGEQLQRAVGEGRVGRKLFPLVIALVVVLLAAEQILANRFYSGARDESK